MAVIPMLIFKLVIIDTGEQPLDNVRNLPIFQRIINEDVTWV